MEGMNTTTRDQLVSDIIDLILESVNLRHKNKSEINSATPLMNSGLGLDSLDILEVVVALEKRFNVKIANSEEGKQIFQNIGTIADFVEAKSP
jgi:acyl carrier protein